MFIDKIGFRIIEVDGDKMLLNGKFVFLCGIVIYEEKFFSDGRVWSEEEV